MGKEGDLTTDQWFGRGGGIQTWIYLVSKMNAGEAFQGLLFSSGRYGALLI